MLVRCKNCFQQYEENFGLCPSCGYADGELPEKPFCLTPGTVIGDRYIVGQELNSGGFGIVYKAWDKKLDTMIAIKEYYPSGLVNRQPGSSRVILVATKREKEFVYGKTRFLEEARNMAKFSEHKNIVNVQDFFEANNTAYIVMEYLDGRNLRQVLDQQNVPLPYDYCIDIAKQVCAALKAIHKENILHRDISPDNIMVCSDGTVKLFDFGAARFSAGVENRVTVVVKPGYAPPEQYDKVNRQDPRTDIYALGATLYHAMTGVVPEESTNRKIDDKLREPSSIDHNIPADISNAIMRAMAVEQQYRFSTVDEFISALTSGKKVASVQKERSKRRRRRTIGICACLALILGAAAAVAFSLKMQKDAATLPDASLRLWYIETGNSQVDVPKAAALESIVSSFTTEYSNVSIDLVPVANKEYLTLLASEDDLDSRPAIFESSGLDVSDFAVSPPPEVAPGSEEALVNVVNLEQMKLTSGIVVPVIFVNTTKGSLDSTASLEDIVQQCNEKSLTMVIDKNGSNLYKRIYGLDAKQYISDSALEDFLNRSVDVYLATTAAYSNVQSNLPGEYAILIPDGETMTWNDGTQWSISNLSGDDLEVAAAFLSYLTSPLAQDYLHVKNFDGELPISKSTMDEFVDIYGELSGTTEFMSRTRVAIDILEPEEEEPEQPPVTELEKAEYDIETKDMSVRNDQGETMAEITYDLVVLTEDTPAVKKINEALYADYQKFADTPPQMSAEELSQQEGLPYKNTYSAEIVHNGDGILSIKYESSWFWGGVYTGDYYGRTFDLNTGDELFISDLVDADETLVLTYLKEHVKWNMRFESTERYLEDADETVDSYAIKDFPFYIENGGIVLCFETYILTYGAGGPAEFYTNLYLDPLEPANTVEQLACGPTNGGWSWLDKSPDGTILFGDFHFQEDMECVYICGQFQSDLLASASGTYDYDGSNLTMNLTNQETGEEYQFKFHVDHIAGSMILTQASDRGPFYYYEKGSTIYLQAGEMAFF